MSIEVIFFSIAAIIAIMPTFYDMKVRDKYLNWWRRLTLAGKIYIILFIGFFGTGLYLTVRSHNDSALRDKISRSRILSDSVLMAGLTLKVNKLYTSDSSYRAALTNGGYQYDSLNGRIVSIKNNTQVVKGNNSSGFQNNAPNYGMQAARDINIGREIELQETDLIEALNMANQLITQFKLSKTALLMVHQLSNGKKAAKQLAEFFESNGFTVMHGVSMGQINNGITISHDLQEKSVVVLVGELK